MPTYEYVCRDCGYQFEAFQSITAEPLTDCPRCNGKVERKISGGSGLIFKGSGFYETDYKKTSASSKPTTKQDDTKETSGKNAKKSVKKAS